jgi:Ala-tRNA(Pro) deacylase
MPIDDLTDTAAAHATARAGLEARLAGLGIATTTVEHPAVFTVAESSELERQLPGGHTKNLFLKDDRGAVFLVVAEASTRVDLKALAKRLKAGRFSFGRPELMAELLGVTPGSVTAFAVMNAPPGRLTVVIDAGLMRHSTLNCHPLVNTATTNIARDDLLRFIRASGHEPVVVEVTAPAAA